MRNKWFENIFRRIFRNKVIFYGNNLNEKCVAITFDDGPHPQNTKNILEILKQEEVKATFFLIGREVDKFPEFAKQYIEEWHEIGNHSFYHIHNVKFRDITKSAEAIKNKSGIRPYLFRPPYGKITPLLLLYLFLKKTTLVMWSVDSNDSNIKDAQELRSSMVKKEIKSGDIILFHEDYPHTVGALRGIIQDLKSKGFSFVTVSEILRK